MSGDADLVLGVDVGTTLVKAAVYGSDGSPLGLGVAHQNVSAPRPGLAEQEPHHWWDGLCQAVRGALSQAGVPAGRLGALGLATQGGTFAFFDLAGRPRGPALVWSDRRLRSTPADPEAADEHFRLTGVSHRGMTPAGIEWVRASQAEWLSAPFRIGFVPDYLTFRLTGRWVTDPTNLAISNLLDLSGGDVALPVLARLDLPRDAFAETGRAGETAGRLTAAAAEALGLVEGIPVAVPAHDQYAAALGAGCVHPGDLLLSAGTAWVLLLTTARPTLDPGSSFWPGPHIERNRWGLLGAISSGCATLDAVLSLTNQAPDWTEIDQAVVGIPAGSEGLLVIPHLIGRTLPTLDTGARGALLGWSPGHRRQHLWRAAMEGVAFETRTARDYLAGHGAQVGALRMVGGAARSPVWPTIVASVLDMAVQVFPVGDIAVRGAACLARRALGEPDLPLSVGWAEHRPDPAWRQSYRDGYLRYRAAIEALEPRKRQQP
ncbi:MAG: FGGY-family carbohydrate kinase [Armatimonadota bacterium]